MNLIIKFRRNKNFDVSNHVIRYMIRYDHYYTSFHMNYFKNLERTVDFNEFSKIFPHPLVFFCCSKRC